MGKGKEDRGRGKWKGGKGERNGGTGKGKGKRREGGREGLVRKFNTYWIRKRNFTVYIWMVGLGGYGKVLEIFNFIHENKAFSIVKPPPSEKKIPWSWASQSFHPIVFDIMLIWCLIWRCVFFNLSYLANCLKRLTNNLQNRTNL